jgi:hypothetical protein
LNGIVSLHDAQEDRTIVIDANTPSYIFVNDKNGRNDRFFLLFEPVEAPTGIHAGLDNDLIASYKDNTVHIVASPLNRIRSVKIYNMQGGLIYASDRLSAVTFDVDTPAKGIFVLDIVSENSRNIRKIVMH